MSLLDVFCKLIIDAAGLAALTKLLHPTRKSDNILRTNRDLNKLPCGLPSNSTYAVVATRIHITRHRGQTQICLTFSIHPDCLDKKIINFLVQIIFNHCQKLFQAIANSFINITQV